MVKRPALLITVYLLSVTKACLAGDLAINASDGPHLVFEPTAEPACTFDELLPRGSNRSMSPEWSSEYVIEPPYDCTCATMKARYFCPYQENSAYHKWVPWSVASGSCMSITRDELEVAPLPPMFKVLLYGNSHLRQVVEAIMCMYEGALTSKRVDLGALAVETVVQGDSQCRACYDVNAPDEISDLQETLLDNGCMAENDTCRCGDSYGEFLFKNGATAHFTFAHHELNKGLEAALTKHGNVPLSEYDAVIMNEGNPPSMSSDDVVASALEVQNAGTQLLWLSTYQGGGVINAWPESQRVSFIESGAKFLDVHRMTQGMKAWTKGKVEGGTDPHFCLPGPPNEMAVLILKLLWAVHNAEK